MPPKDGTKFSKALDRLINHFSDKYNITYAETIGVLQMKIIDLWETAPKDNDEDQENEEYSDEK